jgi:putative hydrolase of the HAD superfamily
MGTVLMVDVDGVLVRGRPEDGRHWAATLEADLGLSYAELRDVFFKRHWDEIVTGRTGLRHLLTAALAQIAPSLTADQLLEYWFRHDSWLNQPLLDELAALRRGGTRCYLATNQEHERMHHLMDTLGLSARFDGCVYSAAVGHRKPSRSFFDAAAHRIGLPSHQLLLIDDAAENVQGAIDAGWQAVLWTGQERLRDLLDQIAISRSRSSLLSRSSAAGPACRTSPFSST